MQELSAAAANDAELGNRLKALRQELGLTAVQMAAHARMSRGFYSQIENGHRPLSDKSAEALRRSLGISPTYLREGTEPRLESPRLFTSEQVGASADPVFFASGGKQVDAGFVSPSQVLDSTAGTGTFLSAALSYVRISQDSATPWRVKGVRQVNAHHPPPEGLSHPEGAAGALLPVTDTSDVRPLVLSMVLNAGKQLDYEVIPKICGGAAAGVIPRRAGQETTLVMDQAGEWAFSFEWMRRNLSHTSGNVASVDVIGDSMSPTLFDGDTVLIDRGFNEVTVDAVYVIDMLGQRLVKRVQRRSDGSLVIISDNKAYARETIPRNRVREISVVGRVVWPRVR